jgi:hypothetical protein
MYVNCMTLSLKAVLAAEPWASVFQKSNAIFFASDLDLQLAASNNKLSKMHLLMVMYAIIVFDYKGKISIKMI